MAKQLQLRRGTTLQHTTTDGGFTGALSEVTVDTEKDVVVVHDNSTVGGFPLASATKGTIGGTAIINTSGAITTTGAIAGGTVDATTDFTVGDTVITDGAINDAISYTTTTVSKPGDHTVNSTTVNFSGTSRSLNVTKRVSLTQATAEFKMVWMPIIGNFAATGSACYIDYHAAPRRFDPILPALVSSLYEQGIDFSGSAMTNGTKKLAVDYEGTLVEKSIDTYDINGQTRFRINGDNLEMGISGKDYAYNSGSNPLFYWLVDINLVAWSESGSAGTTGTLGSLTDLVASLTGGVETSFGN